MAKLREKVEEHENEALFKARRERDLIRNENKQLVGENSRLRQELDLTNRLGVLRNPPTWTAPTKTRAHHGIVTSILSDLHLDEVVNPPEIAGVNAYNRRIAEQRLQRYFEKIVVLTRDYVNNIKYDGVCLFAVGDTLTGEIHTELRETNEAVLQETLDYWIDPMVAGLELLVKEFGQVFVVCLAGNHGRNRDEKRSPAKQRAARNWDSFFWRQVSRYFKGDTDVQFMIPDSADHMVTLYDTRYLATHGDQFRGGSGIAGLFSPLMLGHHRKSKRQQAVGQPFDVMVMGHWHQYIAAASSGLIVNGSLKGYDEYAFLNNLSYEPPQQAFWITTPEHGANGFHIPILVSDRKAEGW